MAIAYIPTLKIIHIAIYRKQSVELTGKSVCMFVSIHTGLHFIPLRKSSGEYASHTGIFVKIAMNKLSQEQASSSGTCSLQNLNSSATRLPPSRLLETCNLSLNEVEEDTTTVEQCQLPCSEEQTISSTCSLSNDTSAEENSTSLPHNRPKMIRQGAIREVTVDIHASHQSSA